MMLEMIRDNSVLFGTSLIRKSPIAAGGVKFLCKEESQPRSVKSVMIVGPCETSGGDACALALRATSCVLKL